MGLDFVDTQEPQVIRPREDIQADIFLTQTRIQEIWNQEIKVYATLGSLEREEAIKIFHDFGGRYIEPLDIFNINEWGLEYEVSKYGLSSPLRQVTILEADRARLMFQRNNLKKEELPYKIKDLESTILSLTEHLDYNALLKSYYDRSGANGIYNVCEDVYRLGILEAAVLDKGDVSKLGKFFADSWSDDPIVVINEIEKWIQVQTQEWTERGLLDKAAFSIRNWNIETITNSRENLLKEIQLYITHIKNFSDLNEIYKPGFGGDYSKISTLLQFFESRLDFKKGRPVKSGNDDSQDFEYPARFVWPIKAFIQDQFLELAKQGLIYDPKLKQKFLEQAQETQYEDVFRSLAIEELSLDKDKPSVLTEAIIKDRLALYIPAFFLKGIDKIRFLPEGSGGKNEDADVVGRFVPNRDASGYIGGVIELYINDFIDNPDEISKELQRNLILETIYHEIAHKVHFNATIDEIEEWEKVILEDDIDVTSYVKRSKKQNKAKGKREDFCESFMLAVDNPALLSVLSEKRFLYMIRLIGSYTPAAQRDTLTTVYQDRVDRTASLWKYSGKTPEMIRNAYLN